MFIFTHMAIGALAQAGLKKKAPTAVVAVLTAAIMDNPILWHAPYPWPADSPLIFQFLPYPHDLSSSLVVAVLIISTIAVAFFLRRYWWGMLWAMSPDIIDWVILRPIIGHGVIHSEVFYPLLSSPWSLGIEVALIAIIVATLLWRKKQPLAIK